MKDSMKAVRDHLRYHGPTCGPALARAVKQLRYSARILELKEAGYTIRKQVCRDPKHGHRSRNYVYELVEERTTEMFEGVS